MRSMGSNETYQRILAEIQKRREARGNDSTTTSNSELPSTKEQRVITTPTPEERARPGFPWANYPDGECKTCLGARFVYLDGIPAKDQREQPCPDCAREDEAKRRLKYSDLPEVVKGFEMFNPTLVKNGQQALETSQAFVDDQLPEYFLTLQGNNGTGKSHLLQASAKVALDNGILVKYVYTPRFLDRLRKTFNDNAEADYAHIFDQYQTPGLLLMDDLGAGRYTDWAVEQVEKLVEARYQDQRKTAFATNLGEDEIAERLGYRVADRIFGYRSGEAKVIVMGGPSYRTGR